MICFSSDCSEHDAVTRHPTGVAASAVQTIAKIIDMAKQGF